ncbi:MAG TPA: MATE family efflux transporter [Syntrophomonadaceae bacterium]|nr:MATE family efflux transporter [Syntrophomonadaceae bacterium]
MDHSEQMRDQKVGRLLWTFSLPTIVGMMVNSLYNIVDRIFVGRGIGSIAIAATTVAFPIMIILMAVSLLIGVGATALISIYLGEQKKEEAERVVGNAVAMLILLPAIFTILFLMYTEPILFIFGASEEVLPYARDFLQIIMLGSVFGSLSMGMNNFIRAEGNPKMAMYTQLLGGGINVVLNYVAIFILGWGIKGSALATVISQFCSLLWVLSYFFSDRSLVKIKIVNMKLEGPILRSIIAIGFAPCAMQLANSLQHLILNKTLMTYGGDMALSAIGIMMSIVTVVFMPILGLSQGAQPIIGYNYGAQQYKRVKETLKIAIISGTCIALAGFIMIRVWPAQVVSLFCKDDIALIQLTSNAMLIYFAAFPLVGFQVICSNYFQAVNKALKSAILSLSRQILIFIPLLLILPRYWGIKGVWWSAPISDLLAAMLTAIFIYVEIKNLGREPTPTSEQVPEFSALKP